MTSDNPYASPESDAPPGNPLQVPAIFLIVFGALFLLLWMTALPLMVRIIRAIDISTPAGMGNVSGQILFLVGTAASNGVIILGSIAMLRRRRHALAQCAAIVACIPICSPCYVLGIPFGIWALRLLGKPDVRSSFS